MNTRATIALKPTTAAPTSESSRQARLSNAIDEFYAAIDNGHSVDRGKLLEKYADIAEELEDCLQNLDFIQQITPQLAAGAASHNDSIANSPRSHLGDFRILREIGRGGMGVVYEAEQLSLGRHVALKVLPFAAMLDKQQLTRFKNEARAAGTLDHPNIVAIHSVGAERGVHYYAMQLIEGRSLAEIIASMKPGRAPSVEDATTALSKPLAAADTAKAALPTVHAKGSAAFSILHATKSSLPTFDSREYCRAVATLGIQGAEALDHAHQNGILHRDVKPGNLLVDDAGKLWITDFGLARIEADAGMTMTGDLLGTLRYMSPEQALAKRVVVDHRSDIYSLGVTLYEFLTLHRAYTADDRQELLRQIAFEEPLKPRQINGRIPSDLETIVLKAIEKNPADRYATAQELADDLRRFLYECPIKARRPRLISVGRKWCRRHQAAVWAAAIVLLVSTILAAASVGWIVRDRATRQAVLDQQIAQALQEADTLYQSDKLMEAMSAVKRAEGLLASGASKQHEQLLVQWRTDLETVKSLEQIRLDQSLPGRALTRVIAQQPAQTRSEQEKDESAVTANSTASDYQASTFDRSKASHAYRETLRKYGVDMEALDVEQAAELIRHSRIKQSLVAALDDWYQSTNYYVDSKDGDKYLKSSSIRSPELLQISRLADPDPWRNRLRDAIQSNDDSLIIEVANEQNVESQSIPTVLLLARALLARSKGTKEANPEEVHPEAEKILRKAQQQHASDFWLNVELARCLPESKIDESIGFLRAAVAVRPDSAGVLAYLASGLRKRGAFAEAEAANRAALRLAPDLMFAHVGLAMVLQAQKRYPEAEVAAQESIRIDPTDHWARRNLTLALEAQGKHREAEAAAREAIRLAPSISYLQFVLGEVLYRQGKLPDAEAAYREGIRLDPSQAMAHNNLSNVLREEKRYPEAEAAVREAIRLDPSQWQSHDSLSEVLRDEKRYPEAEAAAREAVRLNQSSSIPHNTLGIALTSQEKYSEAEAELREAMRLEPTNAQSVQSLAFCLAQQGNESEVEVVVRETINRDPNSPQAHLSLGLTLARQGKFPEAATAFREAIRLDPAKPQAHGLLGSVLEKLQEYVEAEAAYREELRLHPDGWSPYLDLGNLHLILQRYAEAEAVLREACRFDEIEPKSDSRAKCHRSLAVAIAKGAEATGKTERWDEAAAEFVKAIELSPDYDPTAGPRTIYRDFVQWEEVFRRVAKLRSEDVTLNIARAQTEVVDNQWTDAAAEYAKVIHTSDMSNECVEYAAVLLLMGDEKGYQEFCRGLADRFGESADEWSAAFLANACIISPSSAIDTARVEKWMVNGANASSHSFNSFLKGLLQYRSEKYAQAIESLTKSNAAQSDGLRKARNRLVMAMAHQRLGQLEEAQRHFEDARDILANLREKAGNPNDISALDWATAQVLLRETKALLTEAATTDTKAPKSESKSGTNTNR